jgi:hypothetical protein
MAMRWHSHEFSAKETVVGHGAESIGRQVCNFLEQEGVTAGPVALSTYLHAEGTFHNEPVVRAILLYRK